MTLKVGLIGAGMMGRHHGRVLHELTGVELAGVADMSGDPFNVSQGVPVYKSVDELIDAGIDAAVVALPTKFHYETAMQLADSGVHTLVEKPIAKNVVEAEEMTRAFKSKDLIGAVGHIERYNPSLQTLKQKLHEGILGTVYQVVTRRQGPFPTRITDVGVIKDLATHDIDLTAWLLDSSYDTIAANTAFRSGREYEDLVSAVGALDNGVLTNHLVNWLSPLKERVTVVTGEKGTLIANTLTSDLTYYENGTVEQDWDQITAFRGVVEGDIVQYALKKQEPLKTEHEAFRDAILGKSNKIVTMEQGTQTLKAAEAMIKSAKERTTIRV
ncbi:MAG: Gfo/Idh/MocA family oxidoreductase [Micrococcaceae bacterium]